MPLHQALIYRNDLSINQNKNSTIEESPEIATVHESIGYTSNSNDVLTRGRSVMIPRMRTLIITG